MIASNKLKIFNDPIYGFISLPSELVFDLVQHPYFQRLRRISQMGLSYLVYPGAHHTRFHHALGCMHLMQKAVEVLRYKKVSLSETEEEALYIAILLHDVGHGPFSHALEQSIVTSVHHEEISLLLMKKLNKEFNGKLDLAIAIFEGKYHRKFMLQLISSQLDMDRMDYLKRDSFYSGVSEGNINSERLIQMMNVVNDTLVVEEKGIYSVEQFLLSRRLMYWQVYLHKTSLVAECILTRILQRAKELVCQGEELEGSQALTYFLKNNLTIEEFESKGLEKFSLLDDYDVLAAIKTWQFSKDEILSSLCKMIINRDLLKIKLSSDSEILEQEAILKKKLLNHVGMKSDRVDYYVFSGEVKHKAYDVTHNPIQILKKDGSIEEILNSKDQLNISTLSKLVTKYYVCWPKQQD